MVTCSVSQFFICRYPVLSCVLRDQKTQGNMDDVPRHPRCRYQTRRKTSRPALLTLARGRSAASQSVQLVSTGCVLNSGPPSSAYFIGTVGSRLYLRKLEKWAQVPLLPLPTMSRILSQRSMGEQNTGCAPSTHLLLYSY